MKRGVFITGLKSRVFNGNLLNKFKLQNFDDYQLGNESEFEYQDLVSVDLASSQIKNYNLWFNEQR